MIFPKKGVALAPMRAFTQPPLWQVLNGYGAPDAYFSEFVRIHSNYIIEKTWLEEALVATQGKSLWIQLMGNDLKALKTNIKILETYPIAGIDFNVGCPVPKIFKKQAGGGLLRDLPLLRTLLLGLRQICTKPLSVKFRIGFDSDKDFDAILKILIESQIDLATLHARTVSDLYKNKPQYTYIKKAVQVCPFPILANGDIYTLPILEKVLSSTNCHGTMIGRGTLTNPWIFSQWNQLKTNLPINYPTFLDVYNYLEKIYTQFKLNEKKETIALGILKRFSNYLGLAIDPYGIFLKKMRNANTLKAFWNCCNTYLLKQSHKIYTGIPFTHLHAQPNKET